VGEVARAMIQISGQSDKLEAVEVVSAQEGEVVVVLIIYPINWKLLEHNLARKECSMPLVNYKFSSNVYRVLKSIQIFFGSITRSNQSVCALF
jgi:hypothetical protein